MLNITKDIQNLIENNPVAFATTMVNGNPNVIGVTFVKVIDEDKLLVTDNYMNQTLKDIRNNPNVSLVVWNENLLGYKIIGQAKYFSEGKWVETVKSFPENKGLPSKGAILIEVTSIIKSA